MRLLKVFFSVIVLFVGSRSYAQDSDPRVPRFFEPRIGLSTRADALGPNLGFTYGFELNPRFLLGIDSGFRTWKPSDLGRLNVINYGLLLRHRIWGVSGTDSYERQGSFYLQYGLQFRMVFEGGKSGYANCHETELGALYHLTEQWFLKADYVISKLRYFSLPPTPLNGFDLVVGYAHRW